MRKQLTGILALVGVVLTFATPHAQADPFASQWKWGNPKYVGPIESIVTSSSIFSSTSLRELDFNIHRQRVAERSRDTTGTLLYRWELRHNERGDLAEIEMFNDDGSSRYVETATFNVQGRKATLRRSGESGFGEFTYDRYGGIASIRLENDSDGSTIGVWLYTRAADNRVLEATRLGADGSVIQRGTVQYNADGFPEQTIVYNGDGEQTAEINEAYQYDAVGNWVLRVTVETRATGQLPRVETRAITYYPFHPKYWATY